MTNIYRIYPVLWNEAHCDQAQTVYAIDRPTTQIRTACSHRVKEDPAYYWDSPVFQRLLPPPQSSSCCYQPNELNSVRWQCLPAWLTYIKTLGYEFQGELSSLKPMREFYIAGP